ncbi:MAG: 3-dehydroquinate synthase [Pyrinomonadaceae bacterium]
MPRLQVRTRARRLEYEIIIGRKIRDHVLRPAQRVVVVSNKRVFTLYGSAITKSLHNKGFSVSSWLMGDGERHKSVRTAEKALRYLSQTGLERNDALIALGGGVVGDLTGFVAATYLRGVTLIQIPTTLLAQIDSSVGGKTGVNLPAGKNLIGCFHQPGVVIIDTQTLTSLPKREVVAGLCETVKQGAVGGRKLFAQTIRFLETFNSKGILISSELEKLIASHCAFKASIVAADAREDLTKRDHRSRRILNFGHTVGHALEAVTSYRRFRHGEAVGHGMLVAAELSKNLGLLKQSELELLQRAVRLCGPLPTAQGIDNGAIIKAIMLDKKRERGHVQWVLLESIGRPRIVDGKDISRRLLRQSMQNALRTS